MYFRGVLPRKFAVCVDELDLPSGGLQGAESSLVPQATSPHSNYHAAGQYVVI